MSPVTVIVPWRDGCPRRQAALQYVRGWWVDRFPSWQLLVGQLPDGAPWCKGSAVRRALPCAVGTIVVVSDADVIPWGIADAVYAVDQGEAWACPFRGVHRLNQTGTDMLLAGWPLGELDVQRRSPHIESIYVGKPGGGCVVLPAATLEQVPLDPRFVGHGREDLAWGRALSSLAGPVWRSPDRLLHLWHPRAAPRGQVPAVSRELYRRYRRAVTRQMMRRLVDEAVAVYDEMSAGTG